MSMQINDDLILQRASLGLFGGTSFYDARVMTGRFMTLTMSYDLLFLMTLKHASLLAGLHAAASPV
jgi:hypothetical protein